MKCGWEAKVHQENASNNTLSTNIVGLHSLFFILEDEALHTDSKSVDLSFDPDKRMTSDTEHFISTFCKNRFSMSWENRTFLGLFLTFETLTLLGKGET